MRSPWALLLLISAPAFSQVASINVAMSPGDGIGFMVDGATFQGSASFLWPQGSKHTLSVQPTEPGNTPRASYAFVNWTINGTVPTMFTPATLIVTADPSLQSIVANFNTFYEFDVIYFKCPSDGSPCLSPGVVYINTVPYNQTTSIYIAAGSSVNLVVQPNPGYIFTGWSTSPGSGNSGQAFANTYVVNGPLEVYPQFWQSRPISIGLSTSPASLQILADHTPIGSPANLEWGTGTVHAVSVASPQTDQNGGTWVFSAWSDGGAQNHNYTVPDGYSPLSLKRSISSCLPYNVWNESARSEPEYQRPVQLAQSHLRRSGRHPISGFRISVPDGFARQDRSIRLLVERWPSIANLHSTGQ